MDEFFGTLFGSTAVSQQLAYLQAGLGSAIWETISSTVLSTFFAYVIGLPLGVLLVTGEKNGIRPLPSPLMKVINVLVNLLRSIPFLILMVLVRKVTPGLAAENNRIALSGTLVREVGYRKTPMGREIADLMLRVPRPYAGTDYVPCVVWGRCARFCTHLQKGAKLQVVGRMQSREYTKLIDGVAHKRTAYELSIGRLTVLAGEGS